MTWFKEITGVDEVSPMQVRRDLSIDDDCIVCPDGSRLAFGQLEMPSLHELREAVAQCDAPRGKATVREVVDDVLSLHSDSRNEYSLFQVASQFNLLEMSSPNVTPERGVAIYENDYTQGPACAIACGAGTIYRNYFVPLKDAGGAPWVGQSAEVQIDCSRDLGIKLGNSAGQLWSLQNGYLFQTTQGVRQIANHLREVNTAALDDYRGQLRIGLQWNTEVTLPEAGHRVSQAYCSALPIAYGKHSIEDCSEFARLVLEAAYEATICAAILNTSRTGVNAVFLTLLGGGVFGNRIRWITDAIERVIGIYADYDLDIGIVSYRESNHAIAALVKRQSG
ncbi:MAG: hypothetical protein L7U72_18300 [Rubripirellula sp.]|nr:hypothetical protein [Rubripirellula sp.]